MNLGNLLTASALRNPHKAALIEDCSSKQVVLSQDEICWSEENITNE
jgi:hypothetical protein